ncbi:MAG: amino acid adenylation domain-containing protein, partial [Methylococcales bacterium]|nr:amino acid adenylation domain-containing protein [Methylococcales bacterium]
YWQQKLQGLETLNLATDYTRPSIQTFNGATIELGLDAKMTQQLNQLSQNQGTTLFMTLLTSFYTLLHRYTGQSDICVGTPIAGRTQVETESLIGFFVNTLALRTDIDGTLSFENNLQRVKATTLDAYSHQELPFEKVVDVVSTERNFNHSPLFQVVFILQNTPTETIEMSDLSITPEPIENPVSKFDLTLSLSEVGDQINGYIEYNTDLFAASRMQNLTSHFKTLLNAIVADATASLQQLPLLSDIEKQQFINWNKTAQSFPDQHTIHQLFEQQVLKTPDHIAIEFSNQKLTYLQLNEQANQLAHYLQGKGIEAEVLVAICVERSVSMMVAILAVLKAGGAYLPLDPTYPAERLDYMLKDANVSLLITQQVLSEQLPVVDVSVICLDSDWAVIKQWSKSNLNSVSSYHNLAYVIYTSGSTGRPKGVMIEHRGLCNLQQQQINTFNITEQDKVLQFASFSFDAMTSEWLMTLLAGATLVMADKQRLMSPQDLATVMNEHAVSVVTLPPVMLNLLSVNIPSLRALISAGEACSLELVQKWVGHCDFYNAYGPSENSVCATINQCDINSQSAPSIGHPMSNVKLYILDAGLRQLPVGSAGELHISGVGLARGYLNKAQLTEDKFIANPLPNSTDEKLYKTGDLARYLVDGSIEFLGRLDDQIKIRGFRIELGEIESVIKQQSGIDDAIVIARTDKNNNQRLIAYVINESQDSARQSLRNDIAQLLPDYMLPSAIVHQTTFPLTPNGKIDKKALPDPNESIDFSKEYVAPKTDIEKQLVKIWSDILDVETIGIHNNFFELGGHSLLAVALMAKINECFDREIPLATLFKSPTIHQLSSDLSQHEAADWSPLVPINIHGQHQPIFCIPGPGGNVLGLQSFFQALGDDQSCYGLQSIGLDGVTPPLKSIEAMAKAFIEVVVPVQGDHPYYLAGHSFGGLIAFEMARQLQSMGKKIGLLALFDTYAPTKELMDREEDKPKDNAEWIVALTDYINEWSDQDIVADYDALTKLDEEQQLDWIKSQLEQIGLFASHLQIKGLLQVYKNSASIKYIPEGCISLDNVTLFKAKEFDENHPDAIIKKMRAIPTLGWGELLTVEPLVCEVPGDHNSMLELPNVERLAQAVKMKIK